MKTIKAILTTLFALATMMICVIDTEYTPISNILVLLGVWAILALVTSKIDWKNE